jgi:mannose-6-phosphate isomerase-like protein (cupin superfamily)
VRYLIQASASGETGAVTRLFDSASGCETFAQRVLRFGSGLSDEQLPEAADEVLYVLEGDGELVVGESRSPLSPGVGAFVPAGRAWRVSSDGEAPLVILSVLVLEPEASGDGRSPAVVSLVDAQLAGATAARRFQLGATPDVGCGSATQFLGYIPPGRAPDHYHRYDEVVYVLGGDGVLHVAGEESQQLGHGSCIHFPAHLVHCIENTGTGDMTVLGVFRPAGSPAEAYYPDGRLATAEEH